MGKKGGIWGYLKSLGRRNSATEDPLAGFVKIELRPDPVDATPSLTPPAETDPPSASGASDSAEAALTEAVTHCVNTYLRPTLVRLSGDDSLIQHPTSRGQSRARHGSRRHQWLTP